MIAAIFWVLVSLAFVPAHAFTNGSLIPSYFCNPNHDGLPKSLGQLIPFTVKDQSADLAFNANASANLKVVPVTGSKPGNAGYILASFHNTQNRITPIEQGMVVSLQNGTSMVAGRPNALHLCSGTAGVALGGALVYAKDASGARVGRFEDPSETFKPFAGCGRNPEGHIAGVVHQQHISDTAEYRGLSYVPSLCGCGTVTLKGLSVTDDGFGVWNHTFSVMGQMAC